MLIIGLTGAIASGKSTVSRTFHEKYRITIIDADQIAKDVVLPGRKAYKQIVETFATKVPNLIDQDTKMINRAELGKAVFGNKENLAKLNGIVHPAVKFEIASQIIKAYLTMHKMVILDVPLLFESGLNVICSTIITTSCEPKIQMQRLLARNPELSPEDADNRISSQASTRERNARSDYILNNDGSIKDLESQIDMIYKQITPSFFWTYFNLIPGVVFFTAAYWFTIRLALDYYKRSQLTNKKD